MKSLVFGLIFFLVLGSAYANDQDSLERGQKRLLLLNFLSAQSYGLEPLGYQESLEALAAAQRQAKDYFDLAAKKTWASPPQKSCHKIFKSIHVLISELVQSAERDAKRITRLSRPIADYESLKFEILLEYATIALQLITLRMELGKSDSDGSFCDFSERTNYETSLENLVSHHTKLFFSLHGTYGYKNPMKGLETISNQARIYYEGKMLMVIPKHVASFVGFGALGAVWRAARLAEFFHLSLKAQRIGTVGALTAAGAYFSTRGLQQSESLTQLSLTPSEQIEQALSFFAQRAQQDKDQFVELIDEVRTRREERAIQQLLKNAQDLRTKYSFIDRTIQKSGSLKKAIEDLQQRLAELSQ